MELDLEVGGVNFEDMYDSNEPLTIHSGKKKVECSILEDFSGDLYLGSMKLLELFEEYYVEPFF